MGYLNIKPDVLTKEATELDSINKQLFDIQEQLNNISQSLSSSISTNANNQIKHDISNIMSDSTEQQEIMKQLQIALVKSSNLYLSNEKNLIDLTQAIFRKSPSTDAYSQSTSVMGSYIRASSNVALSDTTVELILEALAEKSAKTAISYLFPELKIVLIASDLLEIRNDTEVVTRIVIPDSKPNLLRENIKNQEIKDWQNEEKYENAPQSDRVGRQNGNAPKDNQKQNEQIDAVKNDLGLTQKQRRFLHKEIGHQGYGYQEIKDLAIELFGDIYYK